MEGSFHQLFLFTLIHLLFYIKINPLQTIMARLSTKPRHMAKKNLPHKVFCVIAIYW